MTPNDIGAAISATNAALSKAVQTSVKAVLKEAAAAARENHRGAAAAAVGADRKFRNAGRLDVGTRYAGDEVVVDPKGSWGLVQDGARPHAMPAWGRGRARHPGTRSTQGRKAWTKAADRTEADLDRTVPPMVDRNIERAFRG
jgi:hypothetical protein